MIELIPVGGLCNRMRAIGSACQLARLAGVPLEVRWYRTSDMNCSFGELFKTADLPFRLLDLDATGWRAFPVKAKWRLARLGAQVRGATMLDPDASAALCGNEDSLLRLAREGPLSIRTHSKLLAADSLFAVFRPLASLQSTVDGYLPQLSKAVGVHIRRGDNVKSSQFSPTHLFAEFMQKEIDADCETGFFVATDSPDTTAVLRQRFGDRIIEHPKSTLSRDDPRGIKDALVDLYCLASCRKLIGSYWSSFSDTAWEIRGLEHVILKDAP